MARVGLTRTDDPWFDKLGFDPGLWDALQGVVHRAYMGGISIQGDFARAQCPAVSAAASLGLITTVVDGHFTNRWRPTVKGLRFNQEKCL